MEQIIKETYQTPETEVLGMKLESYLLTDSVKASRSGYGTSEDDSWD